MALQIKKGSTDISTEVQWPTVAWTSVLSKEVDRLEFEITKTPSKTTIPDIGDDISLLEDGVTLFGGVVVERNELIRGGVLIGYQYKCKDYSHYLDRKLVVKTYSGYRADQIFTDIISTFTSGFTTSHVPSTSPTLGTMKFNYEQVTRALTEVCDQIGWDWYVDASKDIHLFDEETLVAPFTITDTNDNMEWASLQINKTILQTKNSVYVRGGEYKKTIASGSAVDIYVAGAGQKVFPLAYKYDNITVLKNGVTQTIGTDQQTDPATVNLNYNFNDRFIVFSNALTGGETIKVYGDAYIPIIALVRDQISIATYGEYQAAVIDKSITSVSEAQSRAKSELKKYSESVFEGSFKTTKTGLLVGQQITITSTLRNLNKTFKINRIVGKARTPTAMEYTIYLIASGQVTFTDIMVQLLTADKQNIDIATNEVLQRLESFIENLTLTDVLTATAHTGPYKWGPDANPLIWGLRTWG